MADGNNSEFKRHDILIIEKTAGALTEITITLN